MRLHTECKGLQAAAAALSGLDIAPFLQEAAERLGEMLLRAAAGRTPVQTGRLRGGYTLTVYQAGGAAVALVENPVHYASFVERGHRTRGGRGFVPGRFMLTFSAQEVEAAAPEVLYQLVYREIERCFSGAA